MIQSTACTLHLIPCTPTPFSLLTQLSDAEETGSAVAAGIIAVCEQLIDHSPRMKITPLAVLPRGNKEVEAPAAKVLIPNK